MNFSNCVLCGLLLIAVGCAPERPTTIPVSGIVTFDGKVPPTNGSLRFAPIMAAEGYPKRGATAKFDAEGKYAVTTFEGNDGLIPGEYRVTVDCWKVAPTMADPASGVSYVAQGFERPEITIRVDDRTRDIPIEVPLAK